MVWMGQHTLSLMCLNGIFYHYINPPTARGVGRPSAGNPIDRIGGGVYDDGSQPGCLHAADPSVEWMASPAGGPAALTGPLLKNLS